MTGRTVIPVGSCLRLQRTVLLRQYSSDAVSTGDPSVGEGRGRGRRITARKRALLDEVIRVDHAGEFGANQIYAGQMAVLGNTTAGPVIKVHLSVCPSVHLFVCPSVCLSVCPSVCPSVHLSVHLSICLSVCLSVCLSICLSVCVCAATCACM